MKTLVTLIAICTLSCWAAPTSAEEVYISEYVEGADIKGPTAALDLAIELFNPTLATINLEIGFVLQIYSDGSFGPSTDIPLLGEIPPGETFVIANPGATAAILAVADMTDPLLVFDGNDVILLAFMPTGRQITVFDVVGQIGLDPAGGCWCSPMGSCSCADFLSTMNTTIRKALAPTLPLDPLVDPFDLAAMGWVGYGPSVFDGLGHPGQAVPVELISFTAE